MLANAVGRPRSCQLLRGPSSARIVVAWRSAGRVLIDRGRRCSAALDDGEVALRALGKSDQLGERDIAALRILEVSPASRR